MLKIIVALAFSVCLILLCNILSERSESLRQRRLGSIHIPPEIGEYTDYSGIVHRISATLSRHSFNEFSEKLKARFPQVPNITSNVAHANEAINKLAAGDGWAKMPVEVIATYYASNTTRKKWLKHVNRRLEDLFDIVIVVSSDLATSEKWSIFLNNWKSVIENINLIIIQTGEPLFAIPVPPWVNQYEVYNKHAIQKMTGGKYWIFDLDKGSKSARSVGCLVADRDFIFFLDTDTLPAKDEQGKIINPLEEHLINLLTPSNPYYFMPQSPYRPGSDFPRGYPYTLKEGIPTVLSHSPVLNVANYDALTRFAKPNERETRRPDVVSTVPYGVLFSLHTANIAINRRVVCPAFYFGRSALKKHNYDIGDKNVDLVTGWVVKVAMDHVRVGVAYGGKGYVINNETIESAQDLKHDLIWIQQQEVVIRFLNELKLSRKAEHTASAVNEIAGYISGSLTSSFHPGLREFGRAMKEFTALFSDFRSFYPKVMASASQSSMAPPPVSVNPHQCAVFTIAHQEPVMLPVWLRYYSKHFPQSLFVAQHFFNSSGTTDPAYLKSIEMNLDSMAPQGVKVGYWKLFGNSEGYPVHFLVTAVETYQERLFRAGFKCVLYTDCDEFIAPDPAKYPGGLKEYLTKFANNSNVPHVRANAYNVGHVSEGNSQDAPLEATMHWNESLLSQRGYWLRNSRYDKPLLSKVPIRWKAGFHNTFVPFSIKHDDDLYLMHMNDVDKTFCMTREKKKYQVISSQNKLVQHSGGFNNHIWNYPDLLKKGIVCKNARAVYMAAKGTAVDGSGRGSLEKMDAKWKNVTI